jgi:hypothetical protein
MPERADHIGPQPEAGIAWHSHRPAVLVVDDEAVIGQQRPPDAGEAGAERGLARAGLSDECHDAALNPDGARVKGQVPAMSEDHGDDVVQKQMADRGRGYTRSGAAEDAGTVGGEQKVRDAREAKEISASPSAEGDPRPAVVAPPAVEPSRGGRNRTSRRQEAEAEVRGRPPRARQLRQWHVRGYRHTGHPVQRHHA